MVTVGDVDRALEAWAPRSTAQSYDNVGLQVGDRTQRVNTALVALDLVPTVIEEAEQRGAQLIVTHHPLLFRPLKRLEPTDYVSGMVWRLVRSGISHVAAHTNLDVAGDGVSVALAGRIGLRDVRPLEPLPDSLLKLVTFVPHDHAESVRVALASSGAGQIGEYEACAFEATGRGYFRPTGKAQPFIGAPGGELERVEEVRLEVELPAWKLDAALAALREAHPYEEVVADVYRLARPYRGAGLGAIGKLEKPLPLEDFLRDVADQLGSRVLRYAGDPMREVQTVAVCGGAGRELIGTAQRERADVFVTSDLTYHNFFDVLDAEGQAHIALVDAGHFETEQVAEELLVERLSKELPAVTWLRSERPTNGVSYFTNPIE